MIGLLLGLVGIGAGLLFASTSKTAEELLEEYLKKLEVFLEGNLKNENDFIEKLNKIYKEKKLEGRNSKIDKVYLYSSEGIENIKEKVKKEINKYEKAEKEVELIKKEILDFKNNTKSKKIKDKEKEYLKRLEIFNEIEIEFLSNKRINILEKIKDEIKKIVLNVDSEVKIESIKKRILKLKNNLESQFTKEEYLDFYFEKEFSSKIDKIISELKVFKEENNISLELKELLEIKNKLSKRRKLKNQNFVNFEKNDKLSIFIVNDGFHRFASGI